VRQECPLCSNAEPGHVRRVNRKDAEVANCAASGTDRVVFDLYLELSGNAAADVKIVGAPHSVAFTGSEKEITGSHRNEGCSVPSDGRPRSVRVDRSI